MRVEPGQIRKWKHSGRTFLVVELLVKASIELDIPLVVIVQGGRQFVEPEEFVQDNSENISSTWRDNGLQMGDLAWVKNHESGEWHLGLIAEVRQCDGPLQTLGIEEFYVLIDGKLQRLFSYEMFPHEEDAPDEP